MGVSLRRKCIGTSEVANVYQFLDPPSTFKGEEETLIYEADSGGMTYELQESLDTPRSEVGIYCGRLRLAGNKRARPLGETYVKRKKLDFVNKSGEIHPVDTCHKVEPVVKLVDALDDGMIMRVFEYLPQKDVGHYMQLCRKTWDSKELWVWRLKKLIKRPVVDTKSSCYYRVAFYRKLHERRFVSNADWMLKHRTLRKSFFPILCNWLVELHFELFGEYAQKLRYKYSPLSTIHLAVKYIFKFLSLKENITSNRLQLVGVSCYKIAAEKVLGEKENKRVGLDDKRYAYYTDNAYTAEEVRNMTEEIKNSLEWNLDVYTPSTAVHKLLEHLDAGILTRLFANYIVDLTMHNTSNAEVISSQIAAAATIVAFRLTKTCCDVKKVEEFCHESTNQFKHVIDRMEKLYAAALEQETGNSDNNTHHLPKLSMVIKHYQSKMIELIQGKLTAPHRRCLFQ